MDHPPLPPDAIRPPAIPRPAPEQLHPALWRASQLGRVASSRVLASSFAALDAELPGGGWPLGALTELLLPQPGVGEWRLLAPVLAALQQGRTGGAVALPRSVLLFDPPAQPGAWALSGYGLDLSQLVLVQGRAAARGQGAGSPRTAAPEDGRREGHREGRCGGHHAGARRMALRLPNADVLWALEQTLASGQAGAVLAWLPPGLRADALRRLQLAAQAHPGPVFLLRELAARLKPSPAPLRLGLHAGAPDTLQLQLLKRRGPPCEATLALALPPVLTAAQQARAGRRDGVALTPAPAPAARRPPAGVRQGAPAGPA